jgi:hypothetical protein
VASGIVAFIAIVFAPYAFIVGGFWGAPDGLLALHIVEGSVFPLSAIPVSFAAARKRESCGQSRLSAAVRFTPLALLLVAPILMWATSKLWYAFL